MEKEVVSYVKHHTFQIIVLVLSIFVILGIGEFYLYKKTQELNMMLSEGLMQIKEEMRIQSTSENLMMEQKVTPSITKGVMK